jgi:hypothetical protein
MSAESLCGAPHPELLKSTAAIDRRQTLNYSGDGT